MGNLTEQPLYQLFLAHFKGEKSDRLVLAYADILGNIQCKSSLTHTRPGRNENQVRWLQPRRQLIKVPKSRRKTSKTGLVFIEL